MDAFKNQVEMRHFKVSQDSRFPMQHGEKLTSVKKETVQEITLLENDPAVVHEFLSFLYKGHYNDDSPDMEMEDVATKGINPNPGPASEQENGTQQSPTPDDHLTTTKTRCSTPSVFSST